MLSRESSCCKQALPMLVRQGFSIVELLVAMTIGVGLLLLTTTLYFSSRSSFRLNNESMRLHQDGSYAMMLMERNLRQAGFGNLVFASAYANGAQITDFIQADGTAAQGLRGCDNGFVKPLGAKKNFSCGTIPKMASFEVGYRVDDHFDSTSGAGTDCNGARVRRKTAVPPDHPAYRFSPDVAIALNRFFVDARPGKLANSLYCQGNGNDSSQPIINNVEDLQLIYGVAPVDDFTPRQYLSAAQVDALSADQQANWKRVISVKLCLQIRSDHDVTVEPQQFVSCAGTAKLATDRKLRAVFTRVVTLRNHAASSLVLSPE